MTIPKTTAVNWLEWLSQIKADMKAMEEMDAA